MTLPAFLILTGIWGFAALVFLLLAASSETGFRYGRRHATRDEDHVSSVSFIVSGMLGLLAFVLALSLSMAQQRFDDRRAVSLTEANAIGTAWLRAGLPDGPEASVLRQTVEAWAGLRLEFVRAGPDPAKIERLNAETNRLQTAIWNQAVAIARPRPDPLAALMLASMNDMFDAATAQRRAFSTRLPTEILWMLFGMSVAATAAVGFHLGLAGRRHIVLALGLLAMWAACITSIVDVSAPRVGSVRADDTPYIWTIQGFGRTPSVGDGERPGSAGRVP